MILAVIVFLGAVSAPKDPRTITLVLENTARCDTDVRITQFGRAVVSRATVLQLGQKRLTVEVDSGTLRMFVLGRQCKINYMVEVPVGNKDVLSVEVGDTPQMVLAR